jgi:hypothetical protein
MVCLRNISVDTLHKGDTDDDDDNNNNNNNKWYSTHTGIFHSHNPSGRTMALGPTQSLREMSTRNISWEVKAAGP